MYLSTYPLRVLVKIGASHGPVRGPGKQLDEWESCSFTNTSFRAERETSALQDFRRSRGITENSQGQRTSLSHDDVCLSVDTTITDTSRSWCESREARIEAGGGHRLGEEEHASRTQPGR
eukprot:2564797-Rhodomonas_salina.1